MRFGAKQKRTDLIVQLPEKYAKKHVVFLDLQMCVSVTTDRLTNVQVYIHDPANYQAQKPAANF
uniref:Uncharacterized protein n=1 Tax=Solanum tuberosum TaxID=4113 RepID=M1BFZ4_SOLTU